MALSLGLLPSSGLALSFSSPRPWVWALKQLQRLLCVCPFLTEGGRGKEEVREGRGDCEYGMGVINH